MDEEPASLSPNVDEKKSNKNSSAKNGEQKDIAPKVEFHEIAKCCGFCVLGRPIDLWNNKRFTEEQRKLAVSNDDEITRARYAAPLIARLYTFCTGNEDLSVPSNDIWPHKTNLHIEESKYCLARKVKKDAHETHLTDGWLLTCNKNNWGSNLKNSSTLLEPSADQYIVAQFLMHCSDEPKKSWCDIMCIAFDTVNEYFDYSDAFALAEPLKRNIGLTRVYYSEKLGTVATLRLCQFSAVHSVLKAPPWMLEQADMAEIEMKLVEHLRIAKPHVFLCNGEYQTHELWRSCLASATRMHKRAQGHTRRSLGTVIAPVCEEEAKKDSRMIAAAKLFDRKSLSMGRPQLYIPKERGGIIKKRKK